MCNGQLRQYQEKFFILTNSGHFFKGRKSMFNTRFWSGCSRGLSFRAEKQGSVSSRTTFVIENEEDCYSQLIYRLRCQCRVVNTKKSKRGTVD